MDALLWGGIILASLLTLSSCVDYDDDIDSLQEQINSLSSLQSSEISTVESSISSLESTISSLSSELSSVQAELESAIAEKASSDEVDALSSEVASLTATISSLSSAVSTLEASLASLESSVSSDIATLSSNIATLETALTEANASIAAAQSTADDALAAATTANETLTTVVAQLAALESDITSQLETLESSVKEALEAAAEAQADATAALTYVGTLKALVEANTSAIEANSTKITALETAQATLESSLSDLDSRVAAAESAIESLWETVAECATKSDLEAIQSEIEEASAALQEEIDVLTEGLTTISEEVASLKEEILALMGIGKQLKSLVFSPELYWGGIEAMEVSYYSYTALEVAAADKTAEQNEDAPTETQTTMSVAPEVTASYYLNPSNAAIYTDVSYYSFIGNTATYVTRSDVSEGIIINSVERDGGMIEVAFSIDNAGLSALTDNTDDEIDVVALQYTDADTTITSDFAALYFEEVTTFYINAPGYEKVDSEEGEESHLATTAAEAIEDFTSETGDYPYIEMSYTYDLDGEQGTLDLDKYINVHKTDDDVLWGGQATINEEGFSLVYELIGYIADDADGTSESEHATIEGSNLTIHKYDADEYSESRVLIGRTPLVRVCLVDDTNDAIAAVGYIIVEIVDKEEEEEVEEPTTTYADLVEAEAITTEYTIACDGTDALSDAQAVTWQFVESMLLDEYNLSKSEFESIYTLVLTEDEDEAVQYDGNYTELDEDDYIGSVSEVTADGSHTTNIIYWTVDQETAYNEFVTEGGTELVTYVKFEPTSNSKSTPDIYIKLTWAPENAPVDGLTITIANSSKIAADWHDDNSRDAGYLDIHFEIGNPTDPDAEDTYEDLVIDDTFIENSTPGDVISSALESYSSTLAEELGDEIYTFDVDQDVESYETSLENIYTTKVFSATSIGVTDEDGNEYELATLDQTDGTVSLTSDETNLEILKEILNSPEYGDYKTSLTFTVGLVASTCDPAGSDLIDVTFESGEDIDVIVVKPLYLKDCSVEGMQWNKYSTLTQDIQITLFDYNGYTDVDFFEYSNGESDIATFYGISDSGLEIDFDNITDTYAGTEGSYYGDKYNITAEIEISVDEETGEVSFGTVTLTQLTSSRSNDFEIYLPISLVYDWGTIYSEVTVTVAASDGE